MFPLYDENPTEIFPIFTMALIAACVAAWVFLQGAGFSDVDLMGSVCTMGTIPAEVTGRTGDYSGVQLGPGMQCGFGGLTWGTVFTSMFLHGSWMHLIGNMWFLWIFGNNIEDSMGHLRFLVFYLLTGVVASASHILSDPSSLIPMVGASGAISAIMGAYLFLYPKNRVQTLFFFIFFFRVIPLPAWVFLGYWFLIQLLSSTMQPAGMGGGVAFWAHIGGFLAGLALVKIFQNRALVNAKRAQVKLAPHQIRHRGWL